MIILIVLIVSVWNNCVVAGEGVEILAGLSLLEPQIRYQDIRTRGVEEVRDWLLKTWDYRGWFGMIVYVGVNLVAQPCFAMEAWGLGRPTSGLQELRDFGGRYPPACQQPFLGLEKL